MTGHNLPQDPADPATSITSGTVDSNNPTPIAKYSDRLLKLIPAEFLAAFLAINSATLQSSGSDAFKTSVLQWSALILLFVIPLYMRIALGITSKKRIAASMVSFIIWVTSFQYVLTAYVFYDPLYSTIAIIIWTLASPILVPE